MSKMSIESFSCLKTKHGRTFVRFETNSVLQETVEGWFKALEDLKIVTHAGASTYYANLSAGSLIKMKSYGDAYNCGKVWVRTE